MKRIWIFTVFLLASSLTAFTVYAQTVSFPGPEFLGRPTANSATVNVVADAAIEAYFEYGLASGIYTSQTPAVSAVANTPIEVVIDGLRADTPYYYRMVYRRVGASSWIYRDEHSFRTQRARGGSYTFTLTADSHLGQYGGQTTNEKTLYQQTLLNVRNDRPDFHIDLGDTFAMDPSPLGTGMTEAEADAAYMIERPYMGLISGSVPIFLAIGNHENEEGWNFDDTFTAPDQSLARVGMKYRKLYFPNPVPDGFYSGNADPLPVAIGGDTYREDYYAWEWGDALFVVLDPYHYSMVWPSEGGTYGGEGQDGEKGGDRWDWTLGIKQYLWFKDVLEKSNAKYKFVFSHHVTGGATVYGRGGVSAAPYFEWGGRNADGTWGWNTKRPASEGWDVPIHQLMVANGVTAYIHGHDHIYAMEKLDGIVYLEVPKPDDAGYAWQPYGYGYNEGLYPNAFVLQNSGHVRINVSSSGVVVDYVRSYLPGDGTNGVIGHTFTIPAGSGSNTPAAPSNLSATAVSSTQINLSWQDNSSNESGFKIERKTGASGVYAEINTAAANAMTYSDTSVSAGNQYYYRVRAYNADGNSAYSGEVSAATSSSTSPPAAPSNLSAAAASSTQINLSWKDNSNNESGFLVEGITAAYTDYQSAEVAAGATSYGFAGLTPGTAYLFRVSAHNAIGSSDYSDIVSATTLTSPPAAPSNLAAAAVSTTQINLSWKDNSNNESGFKIERKAGASGTYSQIAAPGSNAASYGDASGLSPGATYYYRVIAYNAGGNSAYSNEAQAATPSTPPQNANLALNKTVTADSQQTYLGNTANKGNDGSATTRWSASDNRANHWWKVDLGAAYALTGTKVQFQYARNYKYKIEVSTDGVTWTVVVNQATTTSTAQSRQDSFSATGRYVRITYTGLPTYPTTMASHFEFEVYGK